jgi:hypothetical protein
MFDKIGLIFTKLNIKIYCTNSLKYFPKEIIGIKDFKIGAKSIIAFSPALFSV